MYIQTMERKRNSNHKHNIHIITISTSSRTHHPLMEAHLGAVDLGLDHVLGRDAGDVVALGHGHLERGGHGGGRFAVAFAFAFGCPSSSSDYDYE